MARSDTGISAGKIADTQQHSLLRPIPDREEDIKVAARGNEKPSHRSRFNTQDAFLVHDGCVAELRLTCVKRAFHAPSVNGLTC